MTQSKTADEALSCWLVYKHLPDAKVSDHMPVITCHARKGIAGGFLMLHCGLHW